MSMNISPALALISIHAVATTQVYLVEDLLLLDRSIIQYALLERGLERLVLTLSSG